MQTVGWVTRAEADRMIASFPESQRERMARALAPLIESPVPSSASRYDDDEFSESDFSHLFPPKSAAEADRRRDARIAASAAELSDDELYERLFGRRPA